MINPYKGSKSFKKSKYYCEECTDMDLFEEHYMCAGLGCEDCLFYFRNETEFKLWIKNHCRTNKIKRILR